MKICWIDLETTGLDAKKNGIIQLSGMIQSALSGEILQVFDYNCQPHPGDIVNDDALAATQTTREDLADYMPAKIAYSSFLKTLDTHVDKYNRADKMFFAGYNALFDWQFLIEWFVKHRNNYCLSYFWYPPIDVAVIAGQALVMHRHEMRNFKLGTVAETLGIDVASYGELHNALNDINLTRAVHAECIRRLRNQGK